MAKVKGVPITDEVIDDLAVGDIDMLGFENIKAHDFKNFAYRKVNIKNVSLCRMSKYEAVGKDEIERLKPIAGEWSDGAWHWFKDSPEHMVYMRCARNLFNKRREYYGKASKDFIEADKSSLKEHVYGQYKRGDSIRPDKMLEDSRLEEET